LHFGTARVGLFNYLLARQNNGSFILRIEDTDKERSTKEFEKGIMEGLKWLGLEWSEGPDIGGEYGPYRQTERLKIYREYLENLLKEKKAYYCFCSEEELEAQRQYRMSIGEAPIYSGKCADISEEELKKNLAEGKDCVIRFKAPVKKVVFNDLIRGKLEFDSKMIGDTVIAKGLDSPLYNFAVVIDDHLMKISHVVRGEDHLSNTPKQILLQEAMGLDHPVYAHLPLVLAPDKTKLSKRHGTVSIESYRDDGYLPEALINFMVFLGWNPGDEREIFSMDSLVKEFDIKRVQKGGAIFNIEKLNYLNGFYIRSKKPEKLTEFCIPFLEKAGLIEKKKDIYSVKDTGEDMDIEKLTAIISLYQERLKHLSEIAGLTDFFFKKDISLEKNKLKWKQMADEDVKNSLERSESVLSEIKDADWTKENLEKILLKMSEEYSSRGELLWPLRVALSGKEASAGPFDILSILGREKSLNRIKSAKKLL
jgi:nondiscriminating glutamyl-tRNA synthetase